MAIAHPSLKSIQERLEKEKGAFIKDPGGRLKICLVYPNTYKLGMSNLGFQSLYGAFNCVDNVLCERAFLPDKPDMAEMRTRSLVLESYESSRPLKDFDVLAFSMAFEDDYINIPRILTLSGLPLYSTDRGENHPLVMAGGCAVTLNPEPPADFIDFFFIGEAEDAIEELTNGLISSVSGGDNRTDVLKTLMKIEGIYVPRFYDFSYDGATVESVTLLEGAVLPVKRRRADFVKNSFVPRTVVTTPDTEFSNVVLVEPERGCPRGCRFCAAGFMYLPMRERQDMSGAVREGIAATGKVGLVGAAISEYSRLKELLRLAPEHNGEITLSSMRLDMLDEELLKLLKASGYRTITVAPEAGSERMRNVINKCITEDEIIGSIRMIAKEGFGKLKLYFMVGLPTETDDDALAIAELCKKIKSEIKGVPITLSVNPFVPKPVTPFEWHPMCDAVTVERRYGIIKDVLYKEGGFEIDLNPVRASFTQAYLSRGDRRLSRVITEASKSGWKPAFERSQISPEECVYRERAENEFFPWDVIDHGIKKEYLYSEYQRGLTAKTTPPCDYERCTRCGVCA